MVLLVGRSTEHFEALQIGKHHPARGRLVVAARCTLLRIDSTWCLSVNASSSPRHGQGHKEAPRRTFFLPKGDTPSYAKWREAGRAGFQIVPDLLFKNQVVLGLSPRHVRAAAFGCYIVTSTTSRPFLMEPRSRRAQISRFDLRKSNGVSDCLSAARRVVNPEASCMIVSSHLFEAYLECSTKCWLRSRAEPATGNVYAEWARLQNETYLEDGLNRLFASHPESDRAITPPIPKNSKDITWCLAIDVRWRVNDLESCLQAVERISSEGRGRAAQFIPYRFEFANKLAKKHKLLLAFDALLLSEAVGREVNLGK